MKRYIAALLLLCTAIAAGCGGGTVATVRNWQSPDGKFQMDIPEGWRLDAPTPRGFFVQFRAPRADEGFYATIAVEVQTVREGQTFQELIRRADFNFSVMYADVEFLERLNPDAGELKGRGAYIRCSAGGARLKVLRAYFIHGTDFYVVTCTALEEHFGSHIAAFLRVCRSFYVET